MHRTKTWQALRWTLWTAVGAFALAGTAGGAVNTVQVTANIPALGGNVNIGEITVDDAANGNASLDATLTLKPGFAFLLEWYNFRWLNIETDINGNVDDVVDPVVGPLPAIDPAPGDGIANGQPGDTPGPPPAGIPAYPDAAFNDGKPFYYTDAEQAGQVPTRPFSDARSDPDLGGRSIGFTTYLIAESDTDPAIPGTDLCILAGFSWTSTIPAGGGQGDETFGAAIPNPGGVDQALVQGAINNSPTIEGVTFNNLTARLGCALRPCPPPLDGDLDGDGDVDTIDLGILLGDFGCVGEDCVGDIDGDGVVDTKDLGTLLGNFGKSIGACCLPDGTCIEGTTQEGCGAFGGVYLGQGTNCQLCDLLVPGACCLPDGLCIIVPGIECSQLGGEFFGAFSECTPDLCSVFPDENRGISAITFLPGSAPGLWNIEVEWFVETNETADFKDLSGEVVAFVNGGFVGATTEIATINTASGVCLGSTPPCDGSDCGSWTIGGLELDGKCLKSIASIIGIEFCTCACVVVNIAAFDVPLNPGDLVQVEVFPAPGSLDELILEDNFAQTVFEGGCAGTPEGEPCTVPVAEEDLFNGGCNSPAPPLLGSISVGETICGSFAFDGETRDTDWYSVSIAAPGTYILELTSGVVAPGNSVFGFLGDAGGVVPNPDCGSVTQLNPFAVGDGVLVAELPAAGEYWIFASVTFDAEVDCTDYELRLLSAGSDCPADLNGDGVVNDLDLQILLDNLGCGGPGCVGDLNGDGVVDLTDANILKSQFGPCPGGDPVTVTFEYNGKPQLIAEKSSESPLPGFALTLSEEAPVPVIVFVETVSGNPAYAEPGFELPPGGSVALTRPEQASYFIVPPLIPGALAEMEVENYAVSVSKPTKKQCGQSAKDLTIEHTVAVTASAVTVDASFTVPKDACELEVTIEVQEFDSEEEEWVLSGPAEQPTSPQTVAPGESQDIGVTIAAGRRIRYLTRCPNNGPECSFTYTKVIVPN